MRAILEQARLGMLGLPNWNATPNRGPINRWMWQHASPHSVLYGYYRQRWCMPCALLEADDPLLEEIHRPGISLTAALERIRQLGVDYVLFEPMTPEMSENRVRCTDPILKNVTDRRYFERVAECMGTTLYRVHYPGGAQPLTPTPARPMPWLLDYSASGPSIDLSAR
jgi:hypothetical protein